LASALIPGFVSNSYALPVLVHFETAESNTNFRYEMALSNTSLYTTNAAATEQSAILLSRHAKTSLTGIPFSENLDADVLRTRVKLEASGDGSTLVRVSAVRETNGEPQRQVRVELLDKLTGAVQSSYNFPFSISPPIGSTQEMTPYELKVSDDGSQVVAFVVRAGTTATLEVAKFNVVGGDLVHQSSRSISLGDSATNGLYYAISSQSKALIVASINNAWSAFLIKDYDTTTAAEILMTSASVVGLSINSSGTTAAILTMTGIRLYQTYLSSPTALLCTGLQSGTTFPNKSVFDPISGKIIVAVKDYPSSLTTIHRQSDVGSCNFTQIDSFVRTGSYPNHPSRLLAADDGTIVFSQVGDSGLNSAGSVPQIAIYYSDNRPSATIFKSRRSPYDIALSKDGRTLCSAMKGAHFEDLYSRFFTNCFDTGNKDTRVLGTPIPSGAMTLQFATLPGSIGGALKATSLLAVPLELSIGTLFVPRRESIITTGPTVPATGVASVQFTMPSTGVSAFVQGAELAPTQLSESFVRVDPM